MPEDSPPVTGWACSQHEKQLPLESALATGICECGLWDKLHKGGQYYNTKVGTLHLGPLLPPGMGPLS